MIRRLARGSGDGSEDEPTWWLGADPAVPVEGPPRAADDPEPPPEPEPDNGWAAAQRAHRRWSFNDVPRRNARPTTNGTTAVAGPTSSEPGAPGSTPRPRRPATSIGLAASLRLLARKWPLVVLGVALTELACMGALKLVPPSYSSTGTVLLNVPQIPQTPLRPDAPSTTQFVNPYLGTRSFVGELAVTIMAEPMAQERVGARGGGGTYKASLSLGDASLIKIDTTGATGEQALVTWNAVAEEVNAALLRLQKSKQVPDGQLVTAEPLTRPTEAKTETGKRIQAFLATLAIGITVTLASIVGGDRIRQVRRSRHVGPGDEPEEGGPDTPPGLVVAPADSRWEPAAPPGP